jgi:GntR family transcriptional regulator/MocR family aminotransferase
VGTVVAPCLPAAPILPPGPEPATLPAVPPFAMGTPALDLFPRTLWARLVTRAVRRLGPAGLAWHPPAGVPALREAIAAYLAVARGVACRPGQVIVTAGYQAALDLACRLLLRPGDQVWFEDPGYAFARAALVAAEARLVPVPVDEAGLVVAAGIAAAPAARLAVVTPTHQSPLGVALSGPRRAALLGWAARAGAWVVEDDYDSEFHYAGRTPPALKSEDRAERVLLAGSFTKTLFPSLRLGYLVVPPALAGAAEGLQHGVGTLMQEVVAAFMAEGHFARHLRRMRGVYAARRTALARAVQDAFGGRVRIDTGAGGLHLVARLPDGWRDTPLAPAVAALGVKALSAQAVAHPVGQGLLLGFTNVREQEAPRLARAVRAGWGRERAVPPPFPRRGECNA